MAIPPVDTSSSDANDETSPLLPRRSASPSTHTRKDDISHHRNRRRWSSASICLLLLIIIVCLEFADTVPRPALTRIYEAVYCRQYYLEHGFPGDGKEGGAVGGRFGGWAGFGDGKLALSIPEKYCKVPQVQGEVALLKAWQVAFDAAGSLLFAIPWGYFADSYGRRPMLLIIVAAFVAKSLWIQVVCYCWKTMPIRLVWLGSLQSLFGGGAVAGAVLYTSIADVTDQDERVTIFFRFGAAQLFSGFIAPPLSAWLMQFGPFTPTILGTAFFAFGFVILCFLPETMSYKGEESSPNTAAEPPRAETSDSTREPSIHDRVKSLLRSAQDSAAFLTSDMRILILLPTYSIHLLLYNTDDLLLQYSSERFDISISRATLVISLQAGLKVVVLIVLLPALVNYLTTRFPFDAQFKDLLLARCSAAAMALGFLCIGLAPSLPLLITALPIQVAGWGLMFLIRSLVTSFVEQHHVARLYIMLTLVDAAGLMVGTPAMAAFFDWSLSIGSWGGGLPFVGCGLALMMVEFALYSVRVGEEKGEEEVEDDRCSGTSGGI
ncbi:major facilitator superfamily domain-containing protein [Phyllosticta capitalensis]|uniref:major facilitator superfamily domain-containing protein n=1 Tax=Phyllosticta capitalensis TaxID=121624 RepID=UPI00312CD461